MGEETIRRTNYIEAKDGNAAESTESFIRHRVVILMYILLRVGENQIRLKVSTQFEKVFEDLLSRIVKNARGEWTQYNLPWRNTQYCHRFKVFVLHILQIGILLII